MQAQPAPRDRKGKDTRLAFVDPRRVESLADAAPVADILVTAVGDTVKRPFVPAGMVAAVLLFLALQNRIDRRDPKLAVADHDEDPDVQFGPAVRLA